MLIRVKLALLISFHVAAAAVLLASWTVAEAQTAIPQTLGWYQIPNTKIRALCPNQPSIQGVEGCSAVVEDWSGGAFDTVNNRLLIWGGGHGGYAGNEVYALNLNTLSMRRLSDPSTVVRDGCSNGGTYTDGKPASRHTYNHLVYLPNQNAMFAFGGSLWQCGFFIGDTWLFNPSNSSWSKKNNAGGPSATFGISAVYDPNSGLVYAHDDSDLYSYNPNNDSWAKRSNPGAGIGAYKNAVIDPVRKRYYMHSNSTGATLYWYDISSRSGTTAPKSGQTTGCQGFIGDYSSGFEYDPVQDRLVGWNGGNRVYILNPDTLNCTTVSYSSGPPAVGNGTWGRFRYSSALNVFVVCNSIDLDCHALRLTAGSGTPPPPPSAPPPPPPADDSAPVSPPADHSAPVPPQAGHSAPVSPPADDSAPPQQPPTPSPAVGSGDFQARCSAPGVVKCVGFDSPADIEGEWGSNSGVIAGSDGGIAPTLDTAIKASGNSSLKFTVPAGWPSAASGSYFTNFSDDLSVQFGENSELYVQWRQRFSPEFVYPKAAEGIKQAAITTGDQPARIYASCEAIGITMQEYQSEGFPIMYNSCTGSASHGPYDLLQEPYGTAGDYKLQNARPAPYCLYSQTSGPGIPSTAFPPTGNCFGYVANEWMTFQVHIKVGPRSGDEFKNSYIQMWMAREGRPSELVLDYGPYNISAGPAAENQRYGKIFFLPYTQEIFKSAGATWYDELIISRTRIPDPNASGSGSVQTPAKPTKLVVK